MKVLKRIVIVLAVLAVLAVLGVNFFGGSMIRTAVEKVGPVVVGVPITLEGAELRLLRGSVKLNGFKIGNPEGYKTDSAISVGEVSVKLDPGSLLSKKIVIEKIYVAKPEITYEMGLGNSNIGKILKQLEGDKEDKKDDEKKEKKKEKAADKEGGTKVVIKDFLIEDGNINVSAKLLGGVALPVPLPSVHLTDIGEDKDMSVADIISEVFGAIAGAATEAATGAVKLAGKGVGAAADVAGAAGGAAVDAAGAVGGAAVDAAGAAGGAAVDAAGAVGGAAVDAAGAAGGAAVDAAGAVGGAAVNAMGKGVGAVGSLFGMGGKKSDEDKEPVAEKEDASEPEAE